MRYLKGTTEADQKADGKLQLAVLRDLLPYLWPSGRSDLKTRVVIAIGFLVAAKLANVYVPIILKMAVDALAPAGELIVVAPVALLVAYGAARIGARAFGELRDALFAKVVQHAIRRVALRTFRHLHALSLRFHLERQTGGLSRAIERGTKGIEFLLFFVLFNVLPTLLEILLVCGILWVLFDWRFSAVTFITILAYVWYSLQVTEWRLKIRRAMNTADSEANTKAIDSLLNYETVKYFGNEAHEAARYDRVMAAYEAAAIDNRTSLATLNIGQAVIISVGLSVTMIMAAFGVAEGRMTVGDFVMVNAYLMQLAMPLNLLGFVYREIKQALIDMEVMFGLLLRRPEVEDKPGAASLALTGGAINFDKVSFGYDPRRPILKDVSFTVPSGHTVAIVGPSGAGKSTISRLLFRFYDVSGGRILIDDQDLREVTQASLRAAIGIVPQDTVLFNDSIYYNIAYGNPEAGRSEIEAVAQAARIHDFVMSLPDGYDTVVGERGLKLSGGEKQRVAIARALLKDPALLLFDEATSALDSKTERGIQESLREVSQDRSTLVIAHRLSTVIDADEIMVLDHGRIVERGRHQALLAKDGKYAAMWAEQQRAAREQDLQAVSVPTTAASHPAPGGVA